VYDIIKSEGKMFISLEGMDGAGKTTQFNLLRGHLESKGYDIVVTREPGGTPISEKIRDVILDKENMGMNAMCEALLYAASRAEHVDKVIKPALKEGKIVLCDRYVHSSIAYQGYGRQLGADVVAKINDNAIVGIMPDVTFILMLSPESVHDRLNKSGRDHDRLEREDVEFFKRIHRGYTELAQKDTRILLIDASNTIENIASIISESVDNIIEKGL
jgi:dTMP kinase